MGVQKRVLLVEGQDDMHVISHVWRRCNSAGKDIPFEIIEKEGYESLLDSIPSEIKVSGRKSLGVVIDANDDPNSRWDAVIRKLKKEGVKWTKGRKDNGVILPESIRRPRIGVWLMPDNRSAGELEDFVAKMIPDNDPVWPLAERYIDNIPKPARKFAERKIQRAKVHAWLATQHKPRQMGAAIGAGYLDATGPLCAAFAEWLKELFERPPE